MIPTTTPNNKGFKERVAAMAIGVMAVEAEIAATAEAEIAREVASGSVLATTKCAQRGHSKKRSIFVPLWRSLALRSGHWARCWKTANSMSWWNNNDPKLPKGGVGRAAAVKLDVEKDAAAVVTTMTGRVELHAGPDQIPSLAQQNRNQLILSHKHRVRMLANQPWRLIPR